jgi:UrcA family protein
MTTPMKRNIRSSRNLAMMLTLASVATGITFVGTVVAMPGTAYAAERDARPSEKVYYQDLNLATASGASRLHSRIKRAARRVCGEAEYSFVPWSSKRDRCVKETTRNGLTEADQKIAQYREARLAID